MITITGADGFVGGALFAKLVRMLGQEAVHKSNRSFTDIPKDTKIIYHLAYKHRLDTEKDLLEANSRLDDKLLKACDLLPNLERIVFCSSIHEKEISAYGCSKRKTDLEIGKYCQKRSIRYHKYVLRNTFGPGARPYRWSFVATFCADLVAERESNVLSNIIELHFIDDVIDELISLRGCEIKFWKVDVRSIYDILRSISFGSFEPSNELESKLLETYNYHASIISGS